MAVLSRKSLPESQDLVIGVVSNIKKHGIYIKLKEYDNIAGYCHISEVAGAWIRNIRNFVRLDQTVVAKVLRVDEDTKQVDLSLKRVSDGQKREKSLQYKRQNAGIAMLNLVAKKAEKTTQQIREIVEDDLYDVFGSIYDGFEELAAVGLASFEELDIPEDIKQIMFDVAEASIQITKVTVTSTLRIRSYASDGIKHVQELLNAAESAANRFPDVVNEITTVGAPVYRIFLEGLSYPEVDEVYRSIEKELEKAGKELDVEYALEKEGNK